MALSTLDTKILIFMLFFVSAFVTGVFAEEERGVRGTGLEEV